MSMKVNDTLEEKPSIKVNGEVFSRLPEDLYIPPDALRVFLETFEGPLDLLLYLIRRQNIDILDIPIAEITRQYMDYINLMHELRFELAGEYLVMAAMLAEIKSRMLLPKPPGEDNPEEDPRAELVRRLQEYERYKKAALDLDALPRQDRDTFTVQAFPPPLDVESPLPSIDFRELLLAFTEVLKRAQLRSHHHVQREVLSVRERMSKILTLLHNDKFIAFSHFFDLTEGRMGVVVSFLAILELLKGSVIEIVQSEPLAPIYVRAILFAAEGALAQEINYE